MLTTMNGSSASVKREAYEGGVRDYVLSGKWVLPVVRQRPRSGARPCGLSSGEGYHEPGRRARVEIDAGRMAVPPARSRDDRPPTSPRRKYRRYLPPPIHFRHGGQSHAMITVSIP